MNKRDPIIPLPPPKNDVDKAEDIPGCKTDLQ